MTINELKKHFEQNGIGVYKVELCNDEYDGKSIIFLEEEEFIKFLNNNDIKNIFYEEPNYDIDDYTIDEDMYIDLKEKYSLELYKNIEKRIKKYNKELKKIIESKNQEITLVVPYQYNYIWYYTNRDDSNLEDPDEALEEILDEFGEEINQENSFNKKVNSQKKQLKKIIIRDNDFNACVTNQMKEDYLLKLLECNLCNEFDELKEVFLDTQNKLTTKAINFINEIK